jgi:hypothetical protein
VGLGHLSDVRRARLVLGRPLMSLQARPAVSSACGASGAAGRLHGVVGATRGTRPMCVMGLRCGVVERACLCLRECVHVCGVLLALWHGGLLQLQLSPTARAPHT